MKNKFLALIIGIGVLGATSFTAFAASGADTKSTDTSTKTNSCCTQNAPCCIAKAACCK